MLVSAIEIMYEPSNSSVTPYVRIIPFKDPSFVECHYMSTRHASCLANVLVQFGFEVDVNSALLL